MTATFATPRLELLDGLIAAGLEVDRLLGQLQALDHRLGRAHRAMAGPGARTPMGQAYLRRVEDQYEEALDRFRAVRREAQVICRVD